MINRRRRNPDVTPDVPAEIASAAVATADEPHVVKIGASTYACIPPTANAISAVAGYTFVGMPYYYSDLATFTEAPISAIKTWDLLRADPNYADLPPVTSISVDATVSGNVEG